MTPQVRTPVVRMKPSHNILSFGINGSLRRREVSQPQPYTEYYLFNNASNLKAYSNNGLAFAYYGYNAALPKYAFNAKELDEETGMYYYEARYYKPPVFTSRDPMFEKYFWMTPYAYCANNPVKYVDPDGEEIELNDDIVLKGQNNSSVTIKTDLVDINVDVSSLGVDFGTVSKER